jgi:hypothetical protein
MFGESTIDQQLHVLNQTFINFFGNGTDGKARPSSTFSFNTNNVTTVVLGSRPKAKGLQGCGPKGSPWVTSHTPGSVRKCEGVNIHTPKATPTLGDGVPVDSPNFREGILGVKTQWLVAFFISFEISWNVNVWNGLTLFIWTSKTQVMPKRRVGSQTANLILNQKKSIIDATYLATEGVQHTVGKFSTITTTLL